MKKHDERECLNGARQVPLRLGHQSRQPGDKVQRVGLQAVALALLLLSFL
jgi:hypothetical protein